MQTAAAPKTSRLFTKETLRIAVLALVTALIWCCVEDRWTPQEWGTPVEYYRDAGAMDILSVFAGIKAASDDNYIPFASKFNPRLSAPYGASWNDYPNNEQIQVFLTGLLADSIGLCAAANAAMLLLFVLSAVSFYFVCRQFHCAWQWAFAMALVFAFSPFVFAHGQHHLTVAAVWHIPLCLLVCGWASLGGGLQWKEWRFRFAATVAVMAGIQNIYYAAMFVQLLGLACVIQISSPPAGRGDSPCDCDRHGDGRNVPGDEHQHVSLPSANTGRTTRAVTRHYEEIEWTAMKFVDFFMPWQHRFPAFAKWSRGLFRARICRGNTRRGITSASWESSRLRGSHSACFMRLRGASRAAPVPLDAIQFAWIFLFAIVGGVNGLLGAAGFILFRATGRYTIFLLCILLLFLARRLSCLTAKSPLLSAALPAAMVALALWDQTQKWKSADDILTRRQAGGFRQDVHRSGGKTPPRGRDDF